MAFFLITATLYLTALALAHRITDIANILTPSCLRPPPHSHDVYNYSHPIVTTCLYTSAILVAVLGSCLHP